MRSKLRTRRNMAIAIAIAVGAHAGLIWWLSETRGSREAPMARPDTEGAVAVEPAVDRDLSATPTQLVPAGLLLDSTSATHSLAGDTGAQALPRDRDVPGRTSATAGGGAPGGADSFTGRHDRENEQTQVWNNPLQNRLPRHTSGQATHAPRSPESLVRQRERGFDDVTDTRVRARAGTDTPAPGGTDAEDPGSAGLPLARRDWYTADPIFDAPTGSQRAERVDGRTGHSGRALTDVGEDATEADDRGPTRDNQNVGAASDELSPSPIEMTEARAGGDTRGVNGNRPRPGVSALGKGSGSAASTTAGQGTGDAAVRARRRDPYFRRMYRKLDQNVEFPQELALALHQGEVVVWFELSAAGQVSDVRVHKPSGHDAFDQQVIAAVRSAGSFGPVPTRLLRGRDALVVAIAYTFKNPLIR